jgi:uncharacterized protein
MISTLYLMPTQRCNCCCDYCYLDPAEKQKQGSDRYFTAVLERFIQRLLELRPRRPQLRFIGGEPYLKAELVCRLTSRFLEQVPAGMTLVNTNGTLITTGRLASLTPVRDRVHHVVSLDGPAAFHDSRRHLLSGGSAFARALTGVEALTRLGFPVHVNMVLDPDSVGQIEALVRLLRDELGITALAVSLLQTTPPLPVATKLALLTTAYRVATRNGITLSGHHRLLLGHRIPELRCRAGERSILISSDGQANVCQRFVGRGRGVPLPDPERIDFQPLPWRHRVASCYGPSTRVLADALYRLYSREYPAYLEVTALDRVLYGTI